MAEKQNIRLQLDVHPLSLTIDRDLEPFYREGAKLLNQRFQYYRRVMPKATSEQLWMYVALQMAVNYRSDASAMDTKPIAQQLTALDEEIKAVLNTRNTNTGQSSDPNVNH